jgi:putative transposase
MPRVKTLSFVAEFPLQTTAADEKTLDRRLNAARHLYNACLQECLRRLYALDRDSRKAALARSLKRASGSDQEAAEEERRLAA